MYIPSFSQIVTAGLFAGVLKKGKQGEISSGEILDFCNEVCVDENLKKHCTRPFLLEKSKCYNFEWSTEGKLSHTTMEIRDAKSSEVVYYRDTNGDYTAEKNELVYVDFKPKIGGCNSTVEYTIKTCE